MTEPEPMQRAMVIVAHPDDCEFMCAGTVAQWAARGVEVTYVIITNGEKGTDDPEMTRERLIATREQEERAAAHILGVKEVAFLHYPDGELVATLALRRDLAREIRRYRPDAVIVGDPSRRFYGSDYINHPDHRAAAEAALDAIFPTAGNRLFFPELLAEGFQPHSVREVYVSGSVDADTKIDISDTIHLKRAALKEHRSQLNPDDVDKWFAYDEKDKDKDGNPPKPTEDYKRIVLG
jgi:LmbE family N-acetylglucosaminyl deacetylase